MKQLGKIARVSFGHIGYQGAMVGMHIELSSGSSGVCAPIVGSWASFIEHTEHCKWAEEDRLRQHGQMVVEVSKLLSQAKVDTIDKLVGIPVEMEFDVFKLVSWRILTEVL